MSKTKKNSFHWKISAGTTLLLTLWVTGVHANTPKGWRLAGSQPEQYEAGVDKTEQRYASAFLKSRQSSADGFGTLMQTINAEEYKGKRVRLSGLIKSEEVTGWAGLWMRADQGTKVVAFDNMQSRAIKGTRGWQHYDVVLDIPKDATGISFGILLTGTGKVWLSSVKFDAVGADVPVTGTNEKSVPDKPVNLEFAE